MHRILSAVVVTLLVSAIPALAAEQATQPAGGDTSTGAKEQSSAPPGSDAADNASNKSMKAQAATRPQALRSRAPHLRDQQQRLGSLMPPQAARPHLPMG